MYETDTALLLSWPQLSHPQNHSGPSNLKTGLKQSIQTGEEKTWGFARASFSLLRCCGAPEYKTTIHNRDVQKNILTIQRKSPNHLKCSKTGYEALGSNVTCVLFYTVFVLSQLRRE